MFSVYVHPPPGFYFPPTSLFAGHEICERHAVQWGQYSLVPPLTLSRDVQVSQNTRDCCTALCGGASTAWYLPPHYHGKFGCLGIYVSAVLHYVLGH